MLVIARRSGSVNDTALYISRLYRPEVRKNLVARIFLAFVLIMQIPRVLDRRKLALLRERYPRRVTLFQTRDLPQIRAVIDDGLNVVVTRVRYEQRLSGLRVVPVVIRQIRSKTSR